MLNRLKDMLRMRFARGECCLLATGAETRVMPHGAVAPEVAEVPGRAFHPSHAAARMHPQPAPAPAASPDRARPGPPPGPTRAMRASSHAFALVEVGEPPGAQRTVVVDASTFGVGRDDTGALGLVLASDDVSTWHALFVYDEQERVYYLRDLNSFNGTYLDGERIGGDPVAVRDRSIVRFGGEKASTFQIRFR